MLIPTARIIDANDVPALSWGVVGPGSIAKRFVHAVHGHTSQRVVAVAGRDPQRTAGFASEVGVANAHGSVEGLLAEPAIDVVYIATPHSSHREVALQAIASGKHVLVEKPIALKPADAREIFAAARAAGVLAMEAMWTRYLPQMDIMRQIIAAGDLGEIHQVEAGFGFTASYEPKGRLWDPELGGGALLDIGVYPIAFASDVLGTPTRIVASGIKTPLDVDMQANAILTSESGAFASISTSLINEHPNRASVMGTKASLEFSVPFYSPSGLTVIEVVRGENVLHEWRDDRFAKPYDGLSYQAVALAAYVAEGRAESPLHPHDEVVDVLTTTELIRAQLDTTNWLPQ